MKNKILFSLLCIFPMTGNAAIPYRVEQVVMPPEESVTGYDAEAFARDYRFYVGGMYTFSMWNNGIDNLIKLKGKNTSSFDALAGIRLYDIFRLEANYEHTVAKWEAFEMTSETAMVNAIIDARIDNLYRLFYRQHLVPYVGIGAGLSWNSTEDIGFENKITPVVSALAGLGIEFGNHFTLDFGYRYLYMFSPKFDVVPDFVPVAHQFRAGVRINF